MRRSSAAPPDTGLMFYALEADVYDALTCRSITELFFWYSRVHLIRHHHCRQGGVIDCVDYFTSEVDKSVVGGK